jgi:hypothetical protein
VSKRTADCVIVCGKFLNKKDLTKCCGGVVDMAVQPLTLITSSLPVHVAVASAPSSSSK